MKQPYRTDIDGLRAIAVISVILFHFGHFPNGYLGVDIFFVISGYLVTGILYGEVERNTFSALKFYERRVRRIVPLVLFTSLAALIMGLAFMLPDDLENLCQSVFATNFSANNILMRITSADYWGITNDYKPLMHTWSLGIEEQFYVLLPVVFTLFKGSKKKYILPSLAILTAASLITFAGSSDASSKFYFIQHRFYELSIGGMCAIHFSKNPISTSHLKSHHIPLILLSALIFILYFGPSSSNDIMVLSVTILTAGILVLGGLHSESNTLYKTVISNKAFAAIGKISFSLYMWHQIVLAFSRYCMVEKLELNHSIAISATITALSISTYFTIEKPFRNKATVKTKSLFVILGSSFVAITSTSLYVYMIGGIIKDVPELGINATSRPSQLNFFSGQSNINIQYNEDIRALDKPFSDSGQSAEMESHRIKLLVLGDSFGRDIANVLLESSFRDTIELRYSDLNPKSRDELAQRIRVADVIFYGCERPAEEQIEQYGIDMTKVWIVGIKDFGNSNGIHYNRTIDDHRTYRTSMKAGIHDNNQALRKKWGKEKYIDLIELVADQKGRVLVFTPDGKFISQDTEHFTEFGAKYFAALLDSRFRKIFVHAIERNRDNEPQQAASSSDALHTLTTPPEQGRSP